MNHADVFKALSDPARRHILLLLKKGVMTAGEIAGYFETSHATVSYHLAQLKKAKLVNNCRHRNCINYELNPLIFSELMLWISQFAGEE